MHHVVEKIKGNLGENGYLGDVRAEIAWRFGSAVVPGLLS